MEGPGAANAPGHLLEKPIIRSEVTSRREHMAPKQATGLRIVEIKNQVRGSKDLNDEWVRIVNVGTQQWDIRSIAEICP